ncbi:30S ribosomal protein S27ae [Candidatus Woesearchaeota archaeon]|nr:30S ribosomal protein S27ae [Candidatus Woesearchaeota archaeon]
MAEPKKKAKKTMQVWKVYDAKGSALSRKASTCPKCGPGVFMAMHKDRKSCGRCGYTEMAAKK